MVDLKYWASEPIKSVCIDAKRKSSSNVAVALMYSQLASKKLSSHSSEVEGELFILVWRRPSKFAQQQLHPFRVLSRGA